MTGIFSFMSAFVVACEYHVIVQHYMLDRMCSCLGIKDGNCTLAFPIPMAPSPSQDTLFCLVASLIRWGSPAEYMHERTPVWV